ncbi:hypothetical protein [Aquimarina acroporae]|nr:hypothetical protein [Aquimarina acroporae]
MKMLKSIVENIWKGIVRKQGYKDHKDFLNNYKNDEDTFLFI